MKPLYILLLALALFALPIQAQPRAAGGSDEVIYHVFQRSFYDSNGDRHGDLNGLREKIPYLKELGVTSVLMLPLYESVFYHNYFAVDYEKIDPEYGTMQDYLALVKALHRSGLKLYLDMEVQYVTDDQSWWKSAVGNPQSPDRDYILWKPNGEPETMVWGLNAMTGYDNRTRRVTTANLLSAKSLEFNKKLFGYFADPNGDGKFDDGADGFRLDHMMDRLDGKPNMGDLFARFWAPLFVHLRKQSPALKFVAEQAEWQHFGDDYLTRGGLDRVFAFQLAGAIAGFDKKQLERMADTTFALTPAGKQQVVFIELHDTPRFASTVKKNPGKMRVGAALNLLIGGVPSIYYGQELGQTGAGGLGKYGITDGNDIPQREAFEWLRSGEGKGMALWYKGTGPWWDSTNVKPDDGISLEEQRADSSSLWNTYRRLIRLRHGSPALSQGTYQTLKNDNDKVFTFLRKHGKQTVLVAVNLSDSEQTGVANQPAKRLKPLYGQGSARVKGGKVSVNLPTYGVSVVELN